MAQPFVATWRPCGVLFTMLLAMVLVACGRPSPAETPLATTPPLASPFPAPTASPIPVSGLEPIAREGIVWAEVVRRTEGTISPILRPSSVPLGLESVRLLDAAAGTFQVEYSGAGARLLIGVGGLNPPMVGAEGVQRQIPVRGQPATLQLANAERPDARIWLWWEEPGWWRPSPEAAPRKDTFYLIAAEGLEPAAIQVMVGTLATQFAVDSRSRLTVEEYPVVAVGMDAPNHVEYFERLGPEVLARRQAWRVLGPAAQVARTNDALAPFGYRLVLKERTGWDHPFYDLVRDDIVVVDDLTAIWPISVNQAGDNFALLVEPLNQMPRFIQRDRIEPWDAVRHVSTAPVFVGNDLVAVEIDVEPQLVVRRGDRVVYTFSVPAPWFTDPVQGLWSWQGHWVVEFNGQVVVDGVPLNHDAGAAEFFGWRPLDGQPFYFMSTGSRVDVSYAGQILPVAYDEVVHYQCCEPGAFNVRGNDTMVSFHARRSGTWLYVEMGIYDGVASDAVQPPTAPAA